MEELQIEEINTKETSVVSDTSNEADLQNFDSNGHMRKVAEMQAAALTQIVSLHLDRLMAIMVSNNGVSFQRKIQAVKAVKEAFAFALDFGLGVTNANIRQKGEVLAKETNELAATLVKAFDNRMLLLADNLRQSEQEANEFNEQVTENNESLTQGDQNV